MKAIPVGEAQGQLARLMAEACRGELIVLTDGDRRVALDPQMPLDSDEDSPELEAELLKAAKGPFSAYAPEELREACRQLIRQGSKSNPRLLARTD